jgi:drug/metabolite transporter (DMT)-like permease
MVVLLGLAAAVLYGGGDFIGGMASRRVHVLSVLLAANTAGVIVGLAAAAISPGAARPAGLAWGIGAGVAGELGLIVFYVGLATGPMSVVAPLSGLASTVLPVAVALAGGERPSVGACAGAVLCLTAIVLISLADDASGRPGDAGPAGGAVAASPSGRPRIGRAIAYGVTSGAAFGLFFLLIRNAGQSGSLWPVAAARMGELAIVAIAAALLRPRLLPGSASSRLLLIAAAGAGVIDVIANICYVTATRTGEFGLAVVLASLYPGVTVLLARAVLGERLRPVQRAGLGLAALGVALVAA